MKEWIQVRLLHRSLSLLMKTRQTKAYSQKFMPSSTSFIRLSCKNYFPKEELKVTKKRALISVSDKTGVIDFAKELVELGFEIVSTGGTSKALQENGIPVIGISEVTGFPEILEGRVKTLHPMVHGGLLGKQDDEDHLKQMNEHQIK